MVNQHPTAVIPLSGFLGAGKTTLMLAAAAILREKGLRAACVTNDQGGQLVDSKAVEAAGIPYGQVEGGCFCCRFNDLADTLGTIAAVHRPDVILAEAVGSCTDLTATVIRPLKAMYGDRFRVAPLTTVLDPFRAEAMLAEGDNGAEAGEWTPEVKYLYGKQLEEAACLLLNKTDLLAPERLDRLTRMLAARYDQAEVTAASAIDGSGVAAWLDLVLGGLSASGRPDTVPDVDYDTYAAGEAQLGWLNAAVSLEGTIEDADGLCRELLDRMAAGLAEAGAVTAHLKLFAQDAVRSLKLSRVGTESDAVATAGGVAEPSAEETGEQAGERSDGGEKWVSRHLSIWINARLLAEPALLREQVLRSLERLAADYGLDASVHELECFAPARPVPVHRMV
jgi:hypothetical protein